VPFAKVSWKGNGDIGVAAGWWEIRLMGRGTIWIIVGIFWEVFCIPCARKTCLFWCSTQVELFYLVMRMILETLS